MSTVRFGRIHKAYSGLPSHVSRIPPRVEITVKVGVRIKKGSVQVMLEGKGGRVEVKTQYGSTWANTVTLEPGNHRLTLRGTEQTSNGSTVSLVAIDSNDRVAGRSNRFFICAYPVDFTAVKFLLQKSNDPELVGLRVVNRHTSDSGNKDDLGEIRIKEQVDSRWHGNCAKSIPIRSNWRSGTDFPPDFHSVSVSTTPPGAIESHQHFVFTCNRSGVKDVPVKNSAFLITKEVGGTKEETVFRFKKKGFEKEGVSSPAGSIDVGPAKLSTPIVRAVKSTITGQHRQLTTLA